MAVLRGKADLGAFEARLSRAIVRLCPPWLAAEREDLFQSACLRVLRRAPGPIEDIEAAYLWCVAHCVVVDEIRRRRRRPEIALETLDHDLPAGDEGPDRRWEARERHAALHRALAQLRQPRRAAVELYLEGRGLGESARVLGWSPKRVDNARSRGLAELRRILAASVRSSAPAGVDVSKG